MAMKNLRGNDEHYPVAIQPVAGASRLVLIDNYDSFTYNVYQYLILVGAKVEVFRNDEISLEELISISPTQLVVSPGPGNPEEDAGISGEAIRHFAGKIPILGVCMGEQCIFTAFGGKVEVTGEILHGKTSPLRHDAKGIYAGLSQDLPVTRYHSLAGTHISLPECLEVSAWTKSADEGRDVIMGVRHKEFIIEGMQFHPESILTVEGRTMLQNFLQMQGGTWKSVSRPANSFIEPLSGMNGAALGPRSNILDEIFAKRKVAVEQQKAQPSIRPSDLQASYDLQLSPPQIDFVQRMRQTPFALSLMAEVKRASPSKGDIAPHICAPAQAKKYALAGASVISVLTEPEYFKGSIEDLKAVRRVLEGMPNRPAVLRKEFVFDEYQILEARLAGADTVLLIVKMLSKERLDELYKYSLTLGMEPLVEVNTAEEMETALSLGAKVIGVNNRDLTSFDVDLDTTTRLLDIVPDHVILCALSGISSKADVSSYQNNKVSAVLVGEALMRSPDVAVFVQDLLGTEKRQPAPSSKPELKIKICGTRTVEAADAAIEAGAHIIGIILVKGRRRYVSPEVAREISQLVHTKAHPHLPTPPIPSDRAVDFSEHCSRNLSRNDRALLAGVFLDQPLEHILHMQRLLDLDIVQLHGSEPLEWASLIPVPVIRRFGPLDPRMRLRGYHAMPLLDSTVGGTGERLDLVKVRVSLDQDVSLGAILAGGLTPENVSAALSELGAHRQQIVAVDVSSGIEADGRQDLEKIRAFIRSARNTT